jgi:hypothetical protein
MEDPPTLPSQNRTEIRALGIFAGGRNSQVSPTAPWFGATPTIKHQDLRDDVIFNLFKPNIKTIESKHATKHPKSICCDIIEKLTC